MLKRILIAALLWPLVALGQSYPSPTYQNLTVLGTLNASFSLANLPAQAANTVLGNATSSSHTPTAFSLPSCSTTTSALQYTSGTGFSCGSSFANLGGAAFTGPTALSYVSPQLTLNDTSTAGFPVLFFNKQGVNQWALTNNTASGTVSLNRYNTTTGVLIDTPFSINQSTGLITMNDGANLGAPSSLAYAAPTFTLNDTGPNQQSLSYAVAGSVKWQAANSTTNIYAINRFNSGSYVDTPFQISNSTGQVTIGSGGLIVGGGLINSPVSGSTGAFTTLSATGAITPSQTAGIVGTTTNNNASAGSVGEVVTSNVLRASAVSLTTGSPSNVTSISLTAGDWDVSGQVILTPNASTTITQVSAWISTTSASLPNDSDPTKPWFFQGGSFTTGQGIAMQVTRARLSLSATTTVFLSTQNSFGVSTMTGCGFIQARRVR